MTIKVRETWTEIVERARIIEVDSLEDAMDMELDLGEGDEISIELDTNSLNYEIIEEVSDGYVSS
tara:strand:+ start:316 stop:510 length:195 start_codon:yes stop_codon:yes gene_type:complete